MLRKLLTIALPLAVPFIAYWIYLMAARRRARLAATGDLPRWQQAPWTLIVVSAVILMSASLVLFGMTGRVEPGTKLAPPRLENGEVIPARPVEE
jgi:hypothetical protein